MRANATNRARSRTRRAAFTLVELLTVILIIAVLFALLMPTMVRARAQAKSLVCQSNLRQVFQASLLRSVEHRGYIQVAGHMNGLADVTPALLDDADEKRYAYYEEAGVRRPAPLQAALAPYLGRKDVRLDNAANMLADLEAGMLRQVFACPAHVEPQPGIMIAGGGWTAPRVTTSYAYNEGLLGFESPSPRRLRANLTKARPAAEIIYMTDAVPRSDFGGPFIAWYPLPAGRTTLADCYTNADNTYQAGVASQFDQLRHPNFRMNVVFCDGHVEALPITPAELQRGVLLP
jgi:prepilin-type processing-associated H-X9-DG protein/prepilin-type N-terminal cleavage/methylation domain-containing protein